MIKMPQINFCGILFFIFIKKSYQNNLSENLTPALSKGEGDSKIEAKCPPLTPPKEGNYLSEDISEKESV
jgi:hypothetical protein